MSNNNGSVVAGTLWMILISVLLFWLPTFGPLIAGIVGGKKAGGVGPGIIAALLPSIIVAMLLFTFSTALTTMPIVGAIAGMGIFMLMAIQIGPLLLGAIIGGLIA